MALFVVVMAVCAVSSGCARNHLFYDTRELRHEPLEDKQKQALVQLLSDRLKDRRIEHKDQDGRVRVLSADRAGLSKLGLAELGAIWLVSEGGERGGESDIRVQLRKRDSAPVSVLVDLEGNLLVISPPRTPPPEDLRTLQPDDITRRFGLKTKLKGKWSGPERRALVEGLSLLDERELALIRGVRFERRKVSPDGDLMRGALFEMKGCAAVIYMYSSGVAADRYRFAGAPSAPRSAMLHSLLHEIGHAIEQSAARERFCRAKGQPVERANRLIAEGNGMVENGPALRGYLGALKDAPAPTDYGNSSRHESFAESFALFHVDPDALERTRPAVFHWFKSGAHIEALRD